MNMSTKLGHSFGLPNEAGHSRIEVLKWLLSLSDAAIELNFGKLERAAVAFTEEELAVINKFQYVSLHAPVIFQDGGPLSYPSPQTESAMTFLKQLATSTRASTIVFHPDLVEDFGYLNTELGTLLAFENMDAKKAFGTSVADLEKVFTASPQAKWVCDVNHIFTTDPTMQIAKEFHIRFGSRLSHYHLSAFNGFHDTFYQNQHELIILTGIERLDVPLIHEGGAARKNVDALHTEHVFVLQELSQRVTV